MAYGLIFKSLSLNQEVSSIIQRKIYLLQSLGTDLGLHFVFFQRGPYSSELSDYLNSSLGIISSLSFTNCVLRSEVRDNVKHIRKLETFRVCDNKIWFNLLSSLVYINKNNDSFNIDNDKESVIHKLYNFVTEYRKEHCDYAWNILEQENFF